VDQARRHGDVKARRKKDTYLTLCDGNGGGPVVGAAGSSSPSNYLPYGHKIFFVFWICNGRQVFGGLIFDYAVIRDALDHTSHIRE
jgi:hypothetical protein